MTYLWACLRTTPVEADLNTYIGSHFFSLHSPFTTLKEVECYGTEVSNVRSQNKWFGMRSRRFIFNYHCVTVILVPNICRFLADLIPGALVSVRLLSIHLRLRIPLATYVLYVLNAFNATSSSCVWVNSPRQLALVCSYENL